jgi:flagellar protein FlaG
VSNSLALQRTESGEKIEKLQEALADVVARLNESMKSSSKELNFSVDEVSKRIMVSVTDRRTGEVIRQVPSEAILKVAHNIEALKGVIFDKNI